MNAQFQGEDSMILITLNMFCMLLPFFAPPDNIAITQIFLKILSFLRKSLKLFNYNILTLYFCYFPTENNILWCGLQSKVERKKSLLTFLDDSFLKILMFKPWILKL